MGGDACAVPPALREALAAYPAIDAEAAEVRATPIGAGLLHQSFAVETPGGGFVAQRVNAIFAPGIHDNILAVGRHLARRGRTSVTLCETRGGAHSFVAADGSRWRVMERLPGVTFETCERPAQARSAGAAVAAFHSALADFAEPLAPMGFPFHDTAHYVGALRAALDAHREHPRARDVAELAGRALEALEACRPPPGLPLRVVHGDLKFSNVLFAGTEAPDRDRATALIDLDTVCRLPLHFDLGDALRSWSNRRAEDEPEAELDTALYRAAAEGWRAHLAPTLEEDEWRALEVALETVALELCLRFATDVLEARYFAWDETRFASAAEHHWARARGQWSLYEQARATAAERRSALRG